MMWHTPLGLPVVQPYRRRDRQHVRTLLQVGGRAGGRCREAAAWGVVALLGAAPVDDNPLPGAWMVGWWTTTTTCSLHQHTITSLLYPSALQRLVLVDNNDDLPIMKQRQRTAFPPNFIHSIDSSHMMLTAIACREEGACPRAHGAGRGRPGAHTGAGLRCSARLAAGALLGALPPHTCTSCSPPCTLAAAAREISRSCSHTPPPPAHPPLNTCRPGLCGRARLVLDARRHGGAHERAAAREVCGAALAGGEGLGSEQGLLGVGLCRHQAGRSCPAWGPPPHRAPLQPRTRHTHTRASAFPPSPRAPPLRSRCWSSCWRSSRRSTRASSSRRCRPRGSWSWRE